MSVRPSAAVSRQQRIGTVAQGAVIIAAQRSTAQHV